MLFPAWLIRLVHELHGGIYIMDVLHRKEKLIFTAIDVLNEFGVQGLSTKEIAKRQGISEAAIFKHFRTKNELVLAILNHYAQYDPDIITSSRARKADPLEAILYFIRAYAEYYENYPAITVITQAYDVLAGNREFAGMVRDIYHTRLDLIIELASEAKNQGRLIPEADPEKIALMVLGTFNYICLKWRLEKFAFPLKDYALDTLKMLLNSFFIS
jgi:AcrR family transcriptional regulator